MTPIFDLRIRKGVRRRGVRLAVATARPSTLDPNAGLVLRYVPGEEAALLAGLDRALAGESVGAEITGLADFLREGGEDVVIVWGQRCLRAAALRSLLAIAQRLRLAEHEGAGLLEIPAGANVRGLREAGVVPGWAPATPTCPTPRAPGAERRRSPGPPSAARSPRSTCCRPTRCAISPTGACGSRRSAAPGSWWRTPAS